MLNYIKQAYEIRTQKLFKNYSAITSVIALIIAILALVGWEFDIQILKRPIPELISMNPLTAVGIVLSAVSLLLLNQSPENRTLYFAARIIAACVFTIGMLRLMDSSFGFEFQIDRLFYKHKLAEDLVDSKSNRMPPDAAANLVFTGICLMLLKARNNKIIYVSNFLIIITAIISLFSMIGYTYGVHSYSGGPLFLSMPIHTAFCFLLLSLSILFAESNEGLIGVVTGPYRGSQVIELLLPTAVVVPIFLGLLRVYGERSGVYSSPVGTALFATANIIIFVLLILKTAASLNKSDNILLQEIEERKKIEKELKENNVFFDTIFQNVPNMIFVKEANDFRFIQINKDGEALLGISKEQIIGKNVYDFLPRNQADQINSVDRMLFQNGTPVDIHEEIITTPRGDRWLHTKKIPVKDENGKPLYLVGIAEDITERKLQSDKIQKFYKELEEKVQQRTEELYKSEQLFKALLENNVDAICLTNKEGELIYQSPAVERMTGYSLEDRKKNLVLDFLHPEDRKKGRKIFKDLLQKPEISAPILLRFRHKQSHFIWVEGSVTNLLSDKNVHAVVYNFRDITEKKLAEEALAISEEKYRLLFTNNPLPAWVFDIETLHFLEVNDAAILQYGYTSEEFLGMTLKDIRPPEDVSALLNERKILHQNTEIISHGDWRHQKKNGEIIVVDITSRSFEIKGRQARLVLAHDITNKILIEQELSKANETLSLRAMELTSSNRDLEQFAYVASHDLQEPLRMVSSFLQLLEKKYNGLLDETGKQYIHFAVDGAERMKKLILDLLVYSRAGTSKEISTAINMNEIALEVISTFTFALQETGGKIVAHNLPTIIAVRTQMQQLLQNLVSNALKYRRDLPPSIEISCLEDDTHWVFRVTDNGLGIDSRFFEKIFIIFQRLHNKTQYSGTGIGLAICKKIAERHGGSIYLESEPGVGSTFIFSIKKNK